MAKALMDAVKTAADDYPDWFNSPQAIAARARTKELLAEIDRRNEAHRKSLAPLYREIEDLQKLCRPQRHPDPDDKWEDLRVYGWMGGYSVQG